MKPLLLFFLVQTVALGLPLKDLATLRAARSQRIVGYGTVVALTGTGDKSMGLGGQAASVVCSALLPPFAKVGSRIDVTVTSLGQASSLAGGRLLATPLRAPDGTVLSVAEGPVSLEPGETPRIARVPEGGRLV